MPGPSSSSSARWPSLPSSAIPTSSASSIADPTKAPSSSVEPVSDVWSFAASLYQLLTGKFPYRFDPKRDPIDIILNENPVPIRERMPALQKEIATFIDQSLVRNPKDRFPDAGKLLASLEKLKP